MSVLRNQIWSLLFAAAVAVLMLAVLTVRSVPVPLWVMILYPAVGAVLAQMASRTSPTADQMAPFEAGTIAAAAVVLLAGIVNLLLADMLLREIRTGELLDGGPAGRFTFVALPAAAALLWWALQRRLAKLRRQAVERRQIGHGQAAIPAE